MDKVSSEGGMSKDNVDDGTILHDDPNYAVTLPCSPEYFGDFISGLLGRPQTLTGYVLGYFELSRADIVNIFNLIDQRISQQNEASLVQFSVLIEYDDNTTVLLNSLNDFEVYTEVKPRVSVGFQISLTYLVKFIDRNFPEKQSIEISFRDARKRYRPKEPIGRQFEEKYAGFFYKIQHTARTWGVDLSNLVEGHLRTQKKAKISDGLLWVSDKSAWIIFLTGLVLFLVANAGLLHAIKEYERLQIAAFDQHILKLTGGSIQDVFIYLARQGLSGSIAIYVVSVIIYMIVVAILIAIFLIIFGGFLQYDAQGALLLTSESKSLTQKLVASVRVA
jgi:hypothetical protein